MPIQLTTPLDAGDIDSGTYDHVMIMRQIHNNRRKRVVLSLEYGTIDNQEWIGGPAAPTDDSTYPPAVVISGQDYTDLVSTHEPNQGEKTYDAVKRGLYQWLQANYPSLSGQIV